MKIQCRKTKPETPVVSDLHYWIIRYQSAFAIVIEKPRPLFPLPGLTISLSLSLSMCVCACVYLTFNFKLVFFHLV